MFLFSLAMWIQQESSRWVCCWNLIILVFTFELGNLRAATLASKVFKFNLIIFSAGRRGFQLFPRWSVDRGYPYTWHTCWSICLGWSVCGFQRKTECFWNWPGKNLRRFGFLFPRLCCMMHMFDYVIFSLQKYIDRAAALEGLSPYVPLYKVTEGNEPCFFTTYFSWDHAKSAVSF